MDEMIIHIGMPRAASTAIAQFMAQRCRTAHADLRDLLDHPDRFIGADYIRAESVIDGVQFVDEEQWQKWLYQPGGWGHVNADIDINDSARKLHVCYPGAKILVVLRNYDDFIRSVYRYAVHQLPWGRRSFSHYLSTPSGLSHQMIGNGLKAIAAFCSYYGPDNVGVFKFECLEFDRLCRFCGVEPGPLQLTNRSDRGIRLLAKRLLP